MSKFKFKVQVTDIDDIHEMPEGWNNESYLELLKFLDADDPEAIPKEELRDMAAMALIDFEPEEAAEKVLEFRLGDKLNAGQRENIAVDARRESLWEQYSDISFHEEMFNVGVLINIAFPMKFRKPEAAKIVLKVTSKNPDSAEVLRAPTAAFIARLLNDGMNEHNTIYRLFQDNLAGESFPEAEHFIWRFDQSDVDEQEHSKTLTIYTSWNWVDELKGVQAYDSTAYNDEIED